MKEKWSIVIMLLLILRVLTAHPAAASESAAKTNGYIVKIAPRSSDVLLVLKEDIGEEIGNTGDTFYVKDDKELRRLQAAAKIEYIEPNYRASLLAEPTDELYTSQKDLELIDAKDAWYIGCYGNDIRVAVIDSGVNAHSDLQGNLLPGYNYLSNNFDTTDNIGHGTSVAGIIAAECNELGTVGIAYRAKIVPIKCFDNGVETYASHLIEGIYAAVDDYKCDIINLSGGVNEPSQAMEDAVNYAAQNGVIVVAAVGNGGGIIKMYPAGCKNAIGVGSVNNSKAHSSFSRRNDSVFVVAQGEDVWMIKGSTYATGNGTSYSTPQIAGIAAVAKCIDKSVDVHRFKDVLIATSEDLGTVGYDVRFGYGLVNVGRIIDKLLEDTELFVSPVDINSMGDVSVKVYNNSLTSTSCIGIWADYAGNTLSNTKVSELNLGSKEVIENPYEEEYNVLQYLLWDSADSMIPLYKARKATN